MIGQVVTGRGNARSVIERPRNMGFSQALSGAIKKYLGIEGVGGINAPSEARRPKQRRAKRVSVTH